MRLITKPIVILVILVLLTSCGRLKEEINITDSNAEAEVNNPINDDAIENNNQSSLVFSDAELLPIDESSNDDSFQIFRNNLLKAIENKDFKFISEIVAENIVYSFAQDGSREDFINSWQDSYWSELKNVLLLGGTFEEDGTFLAPYIFSKFPDEFDPFDFVVVLDKTVPLYKDNSNDSKVLQVLDYKIVKLLSFESDFSNVQVSDGTIGYIESSKLRNPCDYRVSFIKNNGKWEMDAFIAGD